MIDSQKAASARVASARLPRHGLGAKAQPTQPPEWGMPDRRQLTHVASCRVVARRLPQPRPKGDRKPVPKIWDRMADLHFLCSGDRI